MGLLQLQNNQPAIRVDRLLRIELVARMRATVGPTRTKSVRLTEKRGWQENDTHLLRNRHCAKAEVL